MNEASSSAGAAPKQDWQPAVLESLRNCGVGRQPLSRLRVLLLALGVPALGFAAWLIYQLVDLALPKVPLDVAILLWLFFIAIFAQTLARLRNSWLRQIRQLSSLSAQKTLERRGAKRPVFYLRSFQLDDRIGRPTFAEKYLGTMPFANNEQKIAAKLKWMGPVIAIGRPDENLPALGAARFYASNDLWHAKVADVAKASQLVLWASGITEGLRWEISHLIENLPPGKLIMWAHPHLLCIGSTEREAEWARFREAFGDIFPKPLPVALGDARFFCFADDWTPIPVAPRYRGPFSALRSFINPIGSALRVALRVHQGKLDPAKAAYRHDARDVADDDFAALLGASGKVIRWTRVAAFAIAELAAFWASLYIPAVGRAFARGDLSPLSYPLSIAIRGIPAALEWFYLVIPFLLALTAVFAFRYIRNRTQAALAAAAAYALLIQIVQWILFGFPHQFSVFNILSPFVYTACELWGLSFAVPRYRPIFKALWLGELGGQIVAWILSVFLAVLSRLLGAPTAVSPSQLLDSFFSSLVFATVFWLGIRLVGASTAENTSPPATANGQQEGSGFRKDPCRNESPPTGIIFA